MSTKGHPLATLALDYWRKASKNSEEWRNWDRKKRHGKKWTQAPGPLDFSSDYEYRRRMRSFTLGGMSVPMPEENPPEMGSRYYYPDPGLDYYSIELEWKGDADDCQALKNGFVHLSREHADQHGQAMYQASISCLSSAGFSPAGTL
jgi:hypothetical protein